MSDAEVEEFKRSHAMLKVRDLNHHSCGFGALGEAQPAIKSIGGGAVIRTGVLDRMNMVCALVYM